MENTEAITLLEDLRKFNRKMQRGWENSEMVTDNGKFVDTKSYAKQHGDLADAISLAICALRFPKSNQPLTEEQLREMRGKWVWVESPDPDLTVSGWAYVGKDHVFTYWEYEPDALIGRVVYNLCDYGAWLAYACHPDPIDVCSWTGCDCDYPKRCCTCCSMRCQFCVRQSEYKQARFCMKCGKPQTVDALAELKRRIRGKIDE